MTKLLQINSCIKGSTGNIAQQIGELAIANGWESWITYSARESQCKSESHLISIGSMLSSQIHAIETRLFDRHGLGSKRATKKLVEHIKQIKPDLIHLHNIHGYYINIEVLFNYLQDVDIPVVWTLHDCWAFTGHCVHFTDAKCYKWVEDAGKAPEDYCCSCPKKCRYPTSYFLDRSKDNFKLKRALFTSVKNMTIVSVSHWLGGVTKKSFLGKYPINVIQNGIDINTFYPRPEAAQKIRTKYNLGSKFIILGVANVWSDDVGLQDFYWLREKLADEHFAIVMVGLTESQIIQLPKGITGITRTWDANELAEIYTAADVFFNGSFQETFGLVTAEAMACGTRVMVYNSTACPEIVQEKQTGFIFPVGALNEILLTVLILSQEEKRGLINQNCVNYVRETLDKNEKYQEYIDLYNRLIAHE